MQEREQRTEIVTATLPDGKEIRVRAVALGGLQRVGNIPIPFKEVTDIVGSVSTSIVSALKQAKPRKASIEFGLEVAVEAGKLTALLVNGSSTATLKIALEWGEIDDDDTSLS